MLISIKRNYRNFFLLLFISFCSLLFSHSALAERLPTFLKQIPPADIFPEANRYGPAEGNPMVARV